MRESLHLILFIRVGICGKLPGLNSWCGGLEGISLSYISFSVGGSLSLLFLSGSPSWVLPLHFILLQEPIVGPPIPLHLSCKLGPSPMYFPLSFGILQVGSPPGYLPYL